ncbi:MAG TPA: hypothetical protein DIW37_05400 [Chryseobacterium sp.]|nr:hypothetical protein [Chryseobacterium sp.]
MEIYGTIIRRTEVEQKTENFRVQKFILDASYRDNTSGQMYENTLEFQVSGNSIEKLAAISDNSRVKVFFSPQGKEVEKKDGSGKFIAQNLNAWKFELLIQNQNGTQQSTGNNQSTTGSVYQK